MAEVENGAGWCGFLERVIFAGQPWASLTFSQILRFVRRSPVASRLGCGLPGRKLSRLTPTNVGTLCAFLTGREKCGLGVAIAHLSGFMTFVLNGRINSFISKKRTMMATAELEINALPSL